ncbi:MAG: TetR/AcrR family transcriptional regulator [Phenylobacterium sp.]
MATLVDAPAAATRQSQKAATRQRVIEAARALFDTRGFEGTTIRDIASRAGVAVGSVFTTFGSKGEILSEVMAMRLDDLYAELNRVAPHLRGSVADQFRTMFAVHIEFEYRNARLFLAHIAAAYDWTLSASARPFGRAPKLQQMVRDRLQRGIEAGQVRPDVDTQEVADLLMAAYAWVFRLVITRDADASQLIAAMDRQITLIVEGVAPRA